MPISDLRLAPCLLAAISCSASLATACAEGDPGSVRPETAQVADLTHVLDETFPFIPVPGITFPFKRTPIATIDQHGVAAHRWEIHEHIGTQIDAPSHFFAGTASLDALDPATLIAPLAVVDISDRAARDSDAAMTVADVLAWEDRHGRLPAGAVVLMHSGWEARIADATSFINADGRGSMHFPGISEEAAAFLARDRRVAGIGVDTLSIEPGVDKTFRTHRTWLGAGKWALEVVANLARMPPTAPRCSLAHRGCAPRRADLRGCSRRGRPARPGERMASRARGDRLRVMQPGRRDAGRLIPRGWKTWTDGRFSKRRAARPLSGG